VVAIAFALTVHAILWAPLTIAGLAYLFFHGARLWSRTGTPESAVKKGSF
jgi:threonine/homoserine/homoserine lactone efflux protein